MTRSEAVSALITLRASSRAALKRTRYDRRDYHERRIAALTVALQEMGVEDAPQPTTEPQV